MHILAFELALFLEQFDQVPRNRLAFAVRVSREIQGVGLLECANDSLDVFLVALDDLVLHGKAIVRIDSALLWNQVAHMAIGGHDFEVLAQILADCLRLGGRLDDYEIL